MKKYWWGLLLLLIICCATFRLERRLGKDIRVFYDKHNILMDTYPPKEVWESKRTERLIFLNLTPEQQKEYIKIFWEIREIGMDEEYKTRLEVANKWFGNEGIDGYKTKRGKVMLLCGQPDYLEYMDSTGNFYQEGEEAWSSGENKTYYQVWLYWFGTGFWQQVIKIQFRYTSTGSWDYEESTDPEIMRFFAFCRWKTGPTPDGWVEIRKFVGE